MTQAPLMADLISLRVGIERGIEHLIRNFTDNGVAIGTVFWMSSKTGNAVFGVGVDQSARIGARWTARATASSAHRPSPRTVDSRIARRSHSRQRSES